MLAGIAVVLLLAGAGATAYVVAFHQPAAPRASPLPSRPISVEYAGLVVTAGAVARPAGDCCNSSTAMRRRNSAL